MNPLESIKMAFISVKANKLRSFLTILSVVIGVFAIMGAGSAVNSIDDTVTNELNDLGESTVKITRMPSVQTSRSVWRKYRRRERIYYDQYEKLRDKISDLAYVSVESQDNNMIIKYDKEETDPDVSLIGANDVYFNLNNREIIQGRAITEVDVRFKKNVAVIGNDVKNKLFKYGENPIGKEIVINNQSFEIIGLLDIKGAILNESQDNQVLIPITVFNRYYASWWDSMDLKIKAYSKDLLPYVIDESIGAMRSIRGDKPWEENSFEVETNEVISQQFSSLTGYLGYFGLISGIFALAAAGVGITNIMLISIKERTMEIGLRKAVGAKRKWIVIQFLIETLTITMIGGIIGILMGFFAGFIISSIFNLTFPIAIDWLLFSVGVTTFLGVASGLYPAIKAASLDPIEALRYE